MKKDILYVAQFIGDDGKPLPIFTDDVRCITAYLTKKDVELDVWNYFEALTFSYRDRGIRVQREARVVPLVRVGAGVKWRRGTTVYASTWQLSGNPEYGVYSYRSRREARRQVNTETTRYAVPEWYNEPVKFHEN